MKKQRRVSKDRLIALLRGADMTAVKEHAIEDILLDNASYASRYAHEQSNIKLLTMCTQCTYNASADFGDPFVSPVIPLDVRQDHVFMYTTSAGMFALFVPDDVVGGSTYQFRKEAVEMPLCKTVCLRGATQFIEIQPLAVRTKGGEMVVGFVRPTHAAEAEYVSEVPDVQYVNYLEFVNEHAGYEHPILNFATGETLTFDELLDDQLGWNGPRPKR